MRRLVRLTVILSMGIGGLCAVARAYGQVAALPENIAPSLQTFERCGELPCILGIIPGETSWEVAQSRLADYDSYTYDARFLRVQIRDFGAIVLHRSVDGAQVDWINVNPTPQSGFTLGWLVAQYGAPCQVGLPIYTRSSKTVHYPKMLIGVATAQEHFDAAYRITWLNLYNEARRTVSSLCAPEASNESRYRAWHGFASFDRYFRVR